MKWIRLVWLGCAVVSGGSAAEFQLPTATPITKLKRLYPRTVVVGNGKEASVLVVPADGAVRAAALRLQSELLRRTGQRLPIVLDTDLVDDSWRIDFGKVAGTTLVAFGNVNTNRLLAVLYGQRYVVADSIYPGPGGYVIRTVHDPFAKGVNVLVLAGSDTAGVGRAVDVFLEKHAMADAARNLVLGKPLTDVSFVAKAYPFFPDVTHSLSSKRQPQHTGLDWFAQQWRKAGFMDADGKVITHADRAVQGTAVTGLIGRMGQTHFRTGNPALPPLMKQLLDRNRHLLANLGTVHGMGGRGAGHIHQWDLLEELPIWTDADRLAVTNALLADAALGHERRAFHQQVAGGMTQCVDENHGTFSALRSLQAWQYFDRHYPSAASDYWMRCADAVFAGQASTFQILEDASGYLCYAPNSTMSYALARPNLRYFESGIALHHARLVALACMNNLGFDTGFGDSPNIVQPAFFELLAPAAWYYRDPRLYWVIRNKLPRACGLRIFQNSLAFDLTVEPVRPDEWTGLIQIPIYDAPLAKGDARKVPVYAEKSVVDPALFNKLVFRENWDTDGQYMLLDGAGVWAGPPGPHGHKQNDIHTIANLTAHGRMWLVDHSYEHRDAADHSGVLFLREGKGGYPKRTLARLAAFAQDGRWGITKTTFANTERAVFWRKGKYFLVVDRCVAPTAGEYLARCSWRALGEPSLVGDDLLLEQKGRFLRISSDGGSSLDLETANLTNDHWKRFYPFAKPVVKVFQQDKRGDLKAGDSLGFINLLLPHADREQGTRVRLEAKGKTTAVVRDGREVVVAGLGPLPGTGSACGVFLLDRATAFFGDCTEAGDGALTVAAPADFLIDLRAGGLGIRCVAEREIVLRGSIASVLLDGKPMRVQQGNGTVSLRVPKGTHRLQLTGWTAYPALVAFAEQLRGRLADAPRAERTAKAAVAKTVIPETKVQRLKLGLRVADTVAIDMDRDGKREWVVAGPDGGGAFSHDGRLLARFALDTPLRALAVGDTNGDDVPEIVVGTADHRVCLFRADGTKLWEFTCKGTQGSTDGPPVVDLLRIADLDGDGKAEIVAGANWVHVLTGDGTLRWEHYMDRRRGRITGDFVCGEVADLDGDGQQEIVALFNTSYPLVKAYDHAGNVVLPAGKTAHGGLNISVPRRVAVGPILGDGTQQIICGTSRGIRILRSDESQASAYLAHIGGSVVDLATGGPNHTFLAVADPLCGVRAGRLRPAKDGQKIDWQQLWYHSLAEKISVVACIPTATGTSLVAAGTKGGNLAFFDAETGRDLGQLAVGSAPVVKLLAGPAPGTVAAVAADGTLCRVAW